MFRLNILLLLFLFSCNKEEIEIIPFKITSIEVPAELARASAFYFVIEDRGYVGCGRNDTVTLSDIWEFDSKNAVWKRKNDFLGIARVGSVAVSCNGKAYAGLGYAPQLGHLESQSYLKDFYEYTPETDSWKRLTDYPTSHTDFCITFSCNNKIFVATGFDSKSFDNRTWMYDPQINIWSEVGQIAIARVNSVCIDDGRIFAGLGYNRNLNDWYEFDTINYSWNKRESMPDNGRIAALTLLINEKLFVAGGRHWGGDCDPRTDLSSIYQYNPVSDSWSKAGNLQSLERERAISFSFKNEAFFGLGENNSNLLSDFYKIKIE